MKLPLLITLKYKLAALGLLCLLSIGSGVWLGYRWGQKRASIGPAVSLIDRQRFDSLIRESSLDKEKAARAIDAAKLAALVKTKIVYKERIVERPSDSEVFKEECADWQDQEGRFLFHQKERTLDVDLRFSSDTLFVVDRGGRIHAETSVFEHSPIDNRVIRLVSSGSKVFSIPGSIKPPRYSFSAGALYSVKAGTWVPSASIIYRPFRSGIFGLATADSTDLRIFLGYSWAPRRLNEPAGESEAEIGGP